MKKGQISVEYLIIVGFVVFVVIGLLGVAFYYASGIQDQIKSNQLSNFANKLISSSESVFFAGDPSKTTITAYLPSGVNEIWLEDCNSQNQCYSILFKLSTNSGDSQIAYSSDVPLGVVGGVGAVKIGCLPNCEITSNEGVKRIVITALNSFVTITTSA